MRKQFLENIKTATAARKSAPWAAVVIKVNGGYKAFESANDAVTYRKQK